MSVAVVCNLSDGVIIGVDSALSVIGANGVDKVFEDGGKLFRIGSGIGVATYGLAGFAGRSIGSFLYEFECSHPGIATMSVEAIVEELRDFFMKQYISFAELIYGKPFAEISIPLKELGLVVAGYCPNSFLSEAWQIRIPANIEPHGATRICSEGEFGLWWFATTDPIERYINGISSALLDDIAEFIGKVANRPITEEEVNEFIQIRSRHAYPVMTDSMPLKTGIEYVRFLVNYVIAHYRFTERHPTVGGKCQIGFITYKGREFQLQE